MALHWWLIYVAMGLFAGFFAGLLGIGGGMILVTLMVMAFQAQEFAPDRLLHLALGTSMATIVFTSMSSVRAHHKHGGVRWDIVRNTAAGLIIGTLLGTVIAEYLRSKVLGLLFVVFVIYSAINMMLDIKPKPSRQLPRTLVMQLGAGLIGMLSALVGAGGAFLSTPLMLMSNVPMRNCIGTSAALGLPLALAGSVGFMITGWNKDHLPPLSLGYVYLPAAIAIVLGTFVTVPLGARVAHRVPVKTLKKVFSVILVILAIKMLWSLLGMSSNTH